MKKHNNEIFIVTRSVPLANGLDALLKALSQIDRVSIVKSFEEMSQQVTERKPRIAMIDTSLLGNDPEALLEKLYTLSPSTQRVLLVDDVQAVKWMPRYAEAILIKGAVPSAVTTIVTNLLVEKGEEHEHNDSNQ
jgi:DNA-binding NarL/FixJ family response regulator